MNYWLDRLNIYIVDCKEVRHFAEEFEVITNMHIFLCLYTYYCVISMTRILFLRILIISMETN
jgi:hypothetical protein